LESGVIKKDKKNNSGGHENKNAAAHISVAKYFVAKCNRIPLIEAIAFACVAAFLTMD